jgi:hypothetical protein
MNGFNVIKNNKIEIFIESKGNKINKWSQNVVIVNKKLYIVYLMELNYNGNENYLNSN